MLIPFSGTDGLIYRRCGYQCLYLFEDGGQLGFLTLQVLELGTQLIPLLYFFIADCPDDARTRELTFLGFYEAVGWRRVYIYFTVEEACHHLCESYICRRNGDLVRQRFMLMKSDVVEYVIDSVKRVQTRIRNMRHYLLTALYNAPDTIENYYRSIFRSSMGSRAGYGEAAYG